MPPAPTPALRQYQEAKAAHPDCIVLFRLGDFFEMFAEDAVQAAPVLGVALTSRDFGHGGRVAMCGVPHHSVDSYIRRLLEAGLKVAVCDQVEEARPGAKLVERRVTRVLSAGTLVEESLLEPATSRRCAALLPAGAAGVGVATMDYSTGEGQLGVIPGDLSSALAHLATQDVVEVLVPESGREAVLCPTRLTLTPFPEANFSLPAGAELAESLGLELGDGPQDGSQPAALGALAALVAYGRSARLLGGTDFLRLSWSQPGSGMRLDLHTRRNLELVEPLAPGGLTALRLLDRCRTAAGSRKLRTWLLTPLTELGPLHARQAAVAALMERGAARAELVGVMAQCRDLERLTGRCAHGLAGPRDLQALAGTVRLLPRLAQAAAGTSDARLVQLAGSLNEAPLELADRLTRILVPDPPVSQREGGFIRPDQDSELAAILEESQGARQYISDLEAKERSRTGIRTLKVGYNRVFGYYIEVRRSAQEQLPTDYQRRQTLVGAERYVTAELKERELVVLSARDRALRREQEVLRQLLQAAAAEAAPLSRAAGALAELDALCALAVIGVELGWVIPEIDSTVSLDLQDGRHPLVEQAVGAGRFVANSCRMDGEGERIWLITGPNMAGKSTFLRQVALLCLLGQIGAPIPCSRARFGLVDRIFTRVGAQDDISGGSSTFMVEMTEVAEILREATRRSLVVLDEVGRGTSTYDGLSLAQAILEDLHNRPSAPARVLFSTHYHELTALERMPGLRNYRMEVHEEGSGPHAEITFLHTVVPGGADRSYGLHVARLAGVLPSVVARAEEVLREHESQRPLALEAMAGTQLPLPLPPTDPLREELRDLEVDRMTPLEALQKLSEWQRRSAVSG